MKKILFSFFILMLTVLYSQSLIAQSGARGVVKDSQTKETLVGANIVVSGTTEGVSADMNGKFQLDLAPGAHTLVISYTGYESTAIDVTVESGNYTDVGNVSMEASAIGLAGVSIIADRARERETPVAFSNLNKLQIQEQLGSRDIPLAMDITPNVYSTMQGGGAGDARINVRGFNQRNVAIMINGVPINDMENGWVYWSNWDGIGDATSSIQMQRGLSAVNLATPSIGGTMNVITNPAEQKPGLTYKQEFGTGNFIKSTVMGHTGLINDKWSFSAGGVRKTGQGVIDKTWTDAWAYYFGASLNINAKNRLELYAMGAPQMHGQNTYKQNASAYSESYAKNELDYPNDAIENGFSESIYGRTYNENWGSVDPSYMGKQYWDGKTHDRYNPHYINERENYFHKPLANLNWYSQLSDKLSLFTTGYYSGGKGGGSGTAGSVKWDYSGPSRMLDPDATIANNTKSDTAWGILRNSVNNQWTVGLISKLRWNVSEKFKMSFGIDGRTAEIDHFREVRDLFGGKFFIDKSNDFESGNEYNKGLGDKMGYHNTNTVDWIGGYAQGEYNYEKVTAYAMAGYSMIKYGYINHFAKAEGTDEKLTTDSDWIVGYQAKGGFSYRFTETLNGFVNAGYVSKVPIFDVVIDDGDGTKAADPQNEKFTAFEGGAQYNSLNGLFTVSGNFYYTLWKDRSLSRSVQNENNDDNIVFITGMDQTHYGFEIEGNYRPVHSLQINFAGSINDWTYSNDVSGVYKDYTNPDEPNQEYNFYTNGLKVGDAPQTQFVLGLTVFPAKGLRAQLLGKFYGDYYADFDPFSRTDENDKEQVWKTPSYTVFDLHASYNLPVEGSVGVQFFVHVFNLFDDIFVQDALDNSPFNGYYGENDEYSHEAWTAEVYLGTPRTVNFGVLLNIN